MSAVVVIPARYASTRYPGKPLVALRGATGEARSLLARTIEAGRATGLPVYVATDDSRIADEAARAGVEVILTSESCRNGTERVAEAVARAGIEAEIVVNLQGDAPLTPPHFVTALTAAMRADPAIAMATPRLLCDAETVANLVDDRREGRVGATTVVADTAGDALYFSKEVLPFAGQGGAPVYLHVGLYAYRRAALEAYVGWQPTPLESQEGLEQLRFLEHGWKVRTVAVEAPGAAFWELNNPHDVALIEAYLARMGRA